MTNKNTIENPSKDLEIPVMKASKFFFNLNNLQPFINWDINLLKERKYMLKSSKLQALINVMCC